MAWPAEASPIPSAFTREEHGHHADISFKLGLRAQEIALLQIKEVARLNTTGTGFKLLEVMALPAAYTKGADAMGRSKIQ